MRLTKAQRKQVFQMFGGRCAYCGCELPEKGWHADHVEPVLREWWKSTKSWRERHAVRYDVDEATGVLTKTAVEVPKAGMERPENDRPDNLFPSCRACNLDKHRMTLEDWRSILQDRANVCRRNYSAFRHAERFGLVTVNEKPIVFYFEQFAPGKEQDQQPVLDTSKAHEYVPGRSGFGVPGCALCCKPETDALHSGPTEDKQEEPQ